MVRLFLIKVGGTLHPKSVYSCILNVHSSPKELVVLKLMLQYIQKSVYSCILARPLGWADFHQSWPRSKKNFLGLGMGLERSQKKFQPNRPGRLVSRCFWNFCISLNKAKISKLFKSAEIKHLKPFDPPDYKNTENFNFEPKLWKFM